MASSPPTAAPTAPDFVLRLVEGRGLLGLKAPLSLSLVVIDRLELEVPNLRFPFEGSGEPSKFRNRRCSVREAALRIDEDQLARWLESRPLARYGIDELRVRIAGDGAQLVGVIKIGDRQASFTCRAALSAGATPSRVRLELLDVRTYHPLPVASPLVGLALLYALGARPVAADHEQHPPGLELAGVDRLEVDALTAALWRALLPWGWRLPRVSADQHVHVTGDGRSLVFGFNARAATAVPPDDELRGVLTAGDDLLGSGDLPGALARYEALPTHPIAIDRRIATLAVMPGRLEEARDLAEALLQQAPERVTTTTLLGLALAELGDAERAADQFQRAAVLAERAGEPNDAIEAALRAAELLLPTRPTEATPLLERVIAGRPTHARAAQLLAERYASEGRSQELLRLEKRRLSSARGQQEEAKARVRLGVVWLDFNDDPLRARDEVERALRLTNGDAATFRLYARALERSGELARALEAMEHALEASVDAEPAMRRRDRLLAAQLAQRAGRVDEAHRHVGDLLEEDAGDHDGLELAARLASAHGNLDDALRSYERAAAATDDDGARARLYFAAAQLCLREKDPQGRARVLLDRARDAKPTLEILRAAATLAESEQRFEDLEQLLARLAQMGDRDARTHRARLLLTLGRAADAAGEAEALATVGDVESLQLLVEARRAEGRGDGLVSALERLLEVTRSPEPRIELGKIHADRGDLVRARIVLEEGVPLIGDAEPELTRNALELLCDVLLRQGDDVSLEVALGKVAELRVDASARSRALAAQGAARVRLGRLDAALSSYRDALAGDPSESQARLGLAETAYALRLWDEARAALEPLYEAAPRTDRALRLGEIAERQSRPADAIVFYEAALETGASGADAQRVYGALASLHHARSEWEAEARVLLRAAEDARSSDSNVTRAIRLVQAADLLRQRVGRIDEALPLYDRALELDPASLPALDTLEAIAVERQDYARAAQILSRKVAATAKRPAEQKAILGRLAVLQSEHLGRDDAAREAYSRALTIDPRFRPALTFLARDARRRDNCAEELDVLERLTALAPDPADPDTRLNDMGRLGQLFLEEGRTDDAEAVARRVLSEQPRNAAALALLDNLFTRSGRSAELEAVLAMRVQVETDYEVGIDLNLRRAALLENVGRIPDAVAVYEHVTSLRRNHLPAWSRLAQLLRRTEAWPKLAVALGRIAEQHAADGRRDEAIALFVEQAHLLHDQMNDGDAARVVLERAREVVADSRLVLGALLALARGRRDVDAEASLLDQLIEVEPDARARGLAVMERARALSARGDNDAALRRLRELGSADAPNAALRLRAELEEAVGEGASAIEILDTLHARATGTDPQLERFVLEKLLRLCRVHNPTRAEAIARRLVELEPNNRDALRTLVDAARQRGDDAAQIPLLDRLLDEARRNFAPPQMESQLAFELGEAALRSDDVPRAIARLREAVEVLPDHAAARRALGLCLIRSGSDLDASVHLGRAAELGALSHDEHVILADLYERLGQAQRAAIALMAAGDAAPAHRRALAASQLGDEAGARAAALLAISQNPTEEIVLPMLLAGLSPAATIAQLEELAPRISPKRAAALIDVRAVGFSLDDTRLALERAIALEPTAPRWLALARMRQGSVAAEAFAQALRLDPKCAEAALGAAALAPHDEAIAILAASLAAVSEELDPVDAATLALALGDHELAVGNGAAARTAFARAFAAASLAASRGEPTPALRDLRVRAARALASAARADGNLAAAEAALSSLAEAGASNDADQRALAELLIARGEVNQAIALLEQLPSPGDLLTRALERSGQTARLVDHLAEEAGKRTPDDARPLLLRAAVLSADALDDPARAISLLERALPLGASDADIWERLGVLARDRLKDPERAAVALARAYAADPQRKHLLLGLADYHHDAGERTPARDYYAALLRGGTIPVDVAPRIHQRLAQYARLEADAIEEETHLRRAAELQPDVGVSRRLVELYRMREDRLRLEQALMTLADLVPPEERLPLLREARALMGAAPLVEIDERILLLDRNDVAARQRLLERLRQSSDPALLLEQLEQELLANVEAGEANVAAAALDLGRLSVDRGDHVRAARAFLVAADQGGGLPAASAAMEALTAAGRKGDAAPMLEQQLANHPLAADRDALETLLLTVYLEIAPDRALALIEAARRRGTELVLPAGAYRRLLRVARRFEELAAELDTAAGAAQGAERLSLSLEAVELHEGPLGRPRDAARRLASLFDAHPERRHLAARARNLYVASNEPIYALGILDKEMLTADPEEIPQLKITRGELLLAAGADAEAEAEFLHALITTKRVGRAHAALADVYRKRGDLASALEHLIAAADAPDLEPARAAACAVDAADVLLIEGDTATAERLYQLAAALDPADRRALDALIRLAAAQGSYAHQAELLGRAAGLTADRRERARLLQERARLFEVELGRDLDAYRAYREAVACDPTLRDAVRSLRVMAEARGEWAVAAEQLYRESSLETDARERARTHLRLAQIHEERLFDSEAALRNFEEAAQLLRDTRLPEHESPWPGLVRLYAEARRFAEAADAADRLVATLPDETEAPARAEAISRASSLHARAGNVTVAETRRNEAARVAQRDPSLDPAWSTGTPEEQRRILEERLRREPEGEGRVALLRRLLGLLTTHDDLASLDARAQELLQRAPDDSVAFLARRRVLEGRKDWAGLVALLRARSLVTADLRERAERRYEAGRLAETQLYDVPGAAADYEAALDADGDHVPALDAAADLSFRTRHLQRARALYERLGDRSIALGVDEVQRRRGELAEEGGDPAGARAFYGAATATNPSNLAAQQALARVALRIGDDRGAYSALRAVLELLPRDSFDRAAELRRHLGELAARLGELDDARVLLEALLIDDPQRRDVMSALTDVYERAQEWALAGAMYERRELHADTGEERGELLFRRGEALTKAEDLERASDAYLKAADLNPRHAPTLRRLVRHYLRLGDYGALVEVVGELEALGAQLQEASVEAGLGLALHGDEARGTIIAAMSQPTPAAIVEALGMIPWPVPPTFDSALRTALRAVGGGLGARDRLLPLIIEAPLQSGGRASLHLAAAILLEQSGRPTRARLHLQCLAFLSDSAKLDADLDDRMAALPAPTLTEPTAEQVVAAGARGPLRDVLSDLGPLVLGLAVAPLDVEVSAEATALMAPVAQLFGHPAIDVALLDRLTDPAWAEPSNPPRILVQRRLAGDVGALRFAGARAMHSLHAGLGLIHGRATDDITAMVRAAAALFLPDLRIEGPFVRAWQAELSALGLRAETLPEATRARLEMSLANLVVDRGAAEQAEAYAEHERLTANRVALVVTGDLRAGLTALCGNVGDSAAERDQAMIEDPALADLVAFAFSLAD